MTDTTKTIQELNDIINFLKSKVDATTTFTGTEKADWEKRINDLRNNTESSELSIKGIENLGSYFASEKTKLETEKKIAEEAKETAEKALTDLKKDVGDKLTPALIAELEKYPDLKTALEEIKTKGVNYVVDLSVVNKKIEELKSEVKNTETENNGWMGKVGIGIGVVGILMLGYLTFLKLSKPCKVE